MSELELLVRPEEAARRLNMSRSTIYELLSSGQLESVKVGASRRIPVAALDAFVARLRTEQTTP